jgi:hypothetical protein
MAGPKLFTGGTLTIRAGSAKEIVLPLGEVTMEPVMGDTVTLRDGPVGTLADVLAIRGPIAAAGVPASRMLPPMEPEPEPPQRTVRVRYTGETVVSVPVEWDESMILAAVRGAFLGDADLAGRVVEVVEEWPADDVDAMSLDEHDLAAGNERGAADAEEVAAPMGSRTPATAEWGGELAGILGRACPGLRAAAAAAPAKPYVSPAGIRGETIEYMWIDEPGEGTPPTEEAP